MFAWAIYVRKIAAPAVRSLAPTRKPESIANFEFVPREVVGFVFLATNFPVSD
jgi:hypothetical protein